VTVGISPVAERSASCQNVAPSPLPRRVRSETFELLEQVENDPQLDWTVQRPGRQRQEVTAVSRRQFQS